MSKPTQTTNPLHFEDLDPRRFEDLALALIYRLHSWEDIHHDGRSGSDEGVDIRAVERLTDASLRYWFVQCKRYKSFASADAKTAIDEALLKASPDVLVLVLGCDVSLATRTAYEDYALTRGIEKAVLWTSSKLEVMLYAEHTDLLFSFFGVSLARTQRTQENNLRRGLALKRKLIKLIPRGNSKPNILIRSIDDETYPDVDESSEGKTSPWFKVEFYNHYYNGIEVIVGLEKIIVDVETQRWSIIDYSDPIIQTAGFDYEATIDCAQYEILKVFIIGRIPFRNIFEIDNEGDDYYPFLHLYCRFVDDGMPYELVLRNEVNSYRKFYKEYQFPFAERKS